MNTEILKVEILIVTHCCDLPYLRWALESIQKFAHGFSGVTVLYPEQEHKAFMDEFADDGVAEDRIGMKFIGFDQFPGKGMLDHEAQILMADTHVPDGTTHVFHTDSDCVFREPFSPEDYFVYGKPVLLVEPYEKLKKEHPGRYQWKQVTEEALGFPCEYETMCRHPMVNPKEVYLGHRLYLEERWKMSLRNYYLAGKDEYPQNRAEFNSLGSWAREFFPSLYQWVDVSLEPRPKDKLTQFWGHGPIDQPQCIWLDGKEQIVIPKVLIQEYLGERCEPVQNAGVR